MESAPPQLGSTTGAVPPPAAGVPASAWRQFGELLAARATAERHRADPVAYCREKLAMELVGKQVDIARALIEHRYVLVKSANGVGKTALAGALACWFHDSYDPSFCIVTGPKADQVRDTTFKEIRHHFGRRKGMLPKDSRFDDTAEHYIKGTTAGSETAFQGIHGGAVFLIFEECLGVAKPFWTAGRAMLTGGESYWIGIYNPTDSSTHVYHEETSGPWHVISYSAFEHPNIHEELCGRPPVVPDAVTLDKLLRNMTDWGEGYYAERVDHLSADLEDPATYGLAEFPDGMLGGIRGAFPDRYWQPGPDGEARILARYPSQSAYSIFSEAAFDRSAGLDLRWGVNDVPHVGCDVARFGDDCSDIHVRWGPASIHHESHRKQDTNWLAGRLKELCRWLADLPDADGRFKATDVPVLIDDTGVGGGVTDNRGAYRFIPVNFGASAIDQERYPDVRSEILFGLARRMNAGRLSMSRLPAETVAEIRRQAIGIQYKLDSLGRRIAESKKDMKKRIGRSPDSADGMCLAYSGYAAVSLAGGQPPEAGEEPGRSPYVRRVDRHDDVPAGPGFASDAVVRTAVDPPRGEVDYERAFRDIEDEVGRRGRPPGGGAVSGRDGMRRGR